MTVYLFFAIIVDISITTLYHCLCFVKQIHLMCQPGLE